MMGIERYIWELVEPSCEPEHLTIPLHAAYSRRSHARITQFCQARDAECHQHRTGDVSLRGRFRHGYKCSEWPDDYPWIYIIVRMPPRPIIRFGRIATRPFLMRMNRPASVRPCWR